MKRTHKRESESLLKRVKDTISHYEMLKRGDRVLVAVSGGADSVSLFRALLMLKSGLGIDLSVANLDHGVRGKESANESSFVKALATELKVKCVQKKLLHKKKHDLKRSLEEILREKRYEFLIRCAKKENCNVIATGHNIDDQAETIIMRLIKGVSFDGLAGIPPVREEEGIRLIRPLIRTSRKEIMAFISRVGAEYVEDSSNSDTRFFRNRVRKEVLPFLEKMNPAIKTSLANIADSLREELFFSSWARKEAIRHLSSISFSRFDVTLREYLAQPEAVRREIFRQLFISAGGCVKKLYYRHWMLLDIFAHTQSKGRSLDLPGVTVIKGRGKLSFVSGKMKI